MSGHPGCLLDGIRSARPLLASWLGEDALPFGTVAGDTWAHILEIVVAGHFVALAAFLAQAYPLTAALVIDIADFHAEGGADAGEAVDHQADQRAISQADRGSGIDTIQQGAGFGRFQHRGSCPCARCASARTRRKPD